jgi:hypothetical protein
MDVLDADSGKLLGKVEDTADVHGIAIVPSLHGGFTTNRRERDSDETETFTTLKKISVDKDPDFTLYDPPTKLVLACHGFVNLGEESTVVSFDPQRLTVEEKRPIAGCKTPTGLAMDT